jgi:N6-L-threonylcarbamoyladenine synthase
VLDHDAAILHHLDPCALEARGEVVVVNSELEPDGFWLLFEDVREVRHEVARFAKHVHEVDAPRDIRDFAVDALAEDLGHVRVVDGDGDDLEADRLKVLRHGKSGLGRPLRGLDAEHGDAMGAGEESAEVLHVGTIQFAAMLVLGIETSCDETGAAVVRDDGRVVSDVVQSQVVHAEWGGIVPELASRDHARNVLPVVREALTRADVSLAQIDGIAVTCRPGLVGALLVGVQAAKGMAFGADKPLVGVDHLVGHLLAVFLQREAERPAAPPFPFVALLVSGGHTALYRVDGPHDSLVRELGGTRDDAAGEAYDKVAKVLGLGYPGGPAVDARARHGNERAFDFARPMAHSRSLEMSFSGIKTQVAALVRERAHLDDAFVADVCASFQRAVNSVLSEKLFDAAKGEGIRDVVLGGGVAANTDLRRRVTERAATVGARAYIPPLASCTDNGAMIAYAGAMRLVHGERDGWDLTATSATSLPRATRKGRGRR